MKGVPGGVVEQSIAMEQSIELHIPAQLSEGITGRPSHDPATMAFKHQEKYDGSAKGRQKSIYERQERRY